MIKPFQISFARESLNANGVKNIFIFFRKLEAYVRRVSECHFDTMIWSDCPSVSAHSVDRPLVQELTKYVNYVPCYLKRVELS